LRGIGLDSESEEEVVKQEEVEDNWSSVYFSTLCLKNMLQGNYNQAASQFN
jgi:hypothetical protein